MTSGCKRNGRWGGFGTGRPSARAKGKEAGCALLRYTEVWSGSGTDASPAEHAHRTARAKRSMPCGADRVRIRGAVCQVPMKGKPQIRRERNDHEGSTLEHTAF